MKTFPLYCWTYVPAFCNPAFVVCVRKDKRTAKDLVWLTPAGTEPSCGVGPLSLGGVA